MVRQVAVLSLYLVGAFVPNYPVGGQTILGRLVDGETMQPVRGGLIQLLDSTAAMVTRASSDSLGRFELLAPSSGRYRLQVSARSYHPLQDGPVLVESTDTVGVEFFILPAPEELDPIIVEAERSERRLRAAGFYRRMDRRIGDFLTREDIEEIRPHDFSALIAWGVPGALLRPNQGGAQMPAFPAGRSSTTANGGGWCYPMYFLDGLPLVVESRDGAFPVHPDEIAAVEVYATRGETPVEYRSPQADCGTILIWSRWREGP
jgi:hypothetical protein